MNSPTSSYNSTRSIGYLCISLLAAISIGALLDLAAGVILLTTDGWEREINGSGFLGIFFQALQMTDALSGLCQLGLMVLFLVWLYKAFANLEPLGAAYLEFTPGWAVAWWFIPIFSLFRPFQVVRELWNESDPEIVDPLFSVKGGAPFFIGAWWASFIVMSVAGQAASAVMSSNAREDLQLIPYAIVVPSAINITAALLCAMVIKRVIERQDLRFANLGSQPILEPPAPPTFESSTAPSDIYDEAPQTPVADAVPAEHETDASSGAVTTGIGESGSTEETKL